MCWVSSALCQPLMVWVNKLVVWFLISVLEHYALAAGSIMKKIDPFRV
jgi:hypothetical protein